MLPTNSQRRTNPLESFLNPRFASLPINHRFDKLGHPLPLELHGCGCGLCARRHRALLNFWEAR